ncbi:esterase-like activity of phytase family protein [Suttonella ornithocola]|uniref:Uncharacterized protein conserved in bacteria n=1 Tax=Suttonella ornithocola TaxID=279832 RepID=A0A380MUV8_9GAMM|nr:esterase-like activity of phytase family protein [Suttonella ornithocola]SUO95491.1 Uncharacterized protein conserved in bacteria [Suttonella ornithocola]
MKPILLSSLLALVLHQAYAQTEVTATLAGHAILPAKTFLKMPEDAPEDLQVSGKFTTGERVEKIGSVEGKSDGRPTGLALPFEGQSVQGHSGIVVNKDGTVWLLTDNGFGSKANSSDAALFLRRYKIDWEKGILEPLETVFLRDPNKVVPYRIVHEDTKSRYLTGADFDLESVQWIDGKLWLGDEFGPYLIKANKNGVVEGVYPTIVEGNIIQSPDNPALKLPSKPDEKMPAFQAKRSKGFEGMAAAPNGGLLYPLLEGPLFVNGEYESVDGKVVLRILAFDTKKEKYTDKYWFYPLEVSEHAIGDFNMIDDEYGLIIERDNLEGASDRACSEVAVDTKNCFAKPAKFKRVYKVRLPKDRRVVEKIAYIDLMNIKDPNNKARKDLNDGVFTFPFFTIEDVGVVDGSHIIVGNDIVKSLIIQSIQSRYKEQLVVELSKIN